MQTTVNTSLTHFDSRRTDGEDDMRSGLVSISEPKNTHLQKVLRLMEACAHETGDK